MQDVLQNSYTNYYGEWSSSDSQDTDWEELTESAQEPHAVPIFQWKQSGNGAPHSPFTQPQGNHPVDVAVRRFMSDHAYQKPLLLVTPGDNLWCFFFSVQRVFSSRGFPIPPLPLMFKIYKEIAEKAAFEFQMENDNNFRVDQGAMVLHEVGRRMGLGNVQLGTWRSQDPGIRRSTDPSVVLYDYPGSENAAANHVFWLRHTGPIDFGHFEGLSAVGSWRWPLAVDVHMLLRREQCPAMVDRIMYVDACMAAKGSSIVGVPDEELLRLVYPPEAFIQKPVPESRDNNTAGDHTASRDLGDANVEDAHVGDANAGDANAGDANAGDACIKEEEVPAIGCFSAKTGRNVNILE